MGCLAPTVNLRPTTPPPPPPPGAALNLPPNLLKKTRQAGAAIKAKEQAARTQELTDSLSGGPPVVIPHVDVLEHLPAINTLLTGKQNAAIHSANFKYGAWLFLGRLAPYVIAW